MHRLMHRLAALAVPILLPACASHGGTAACATPPCGVYKAPEDAAGCRAPCTPAAAPPDSVSRMFQPWVDGYAEELRFVVGDQLQVSLPFYEDENTLSRVAPDGKLYIGLLGGVAAVNRTPAELERELERRYAEFLRYPDVGLVPTDLTNRLVYVGGEVEEPGALVLRGPTGVLEAVYEAGGFEDTARQESVVLIRRGPSGLPMMKVLDLRSFAKSGTPSENTLLQPFDIVVVSKSPIAKLNLFVAQYIEGVVPFNQSFNYVLYDAAAP